MVDLVLDNLGRPAGEGLDPLLEFVVHHADEKAGGLSAVLEDSVYLGLNTHYYLKLTGGASVELIQESAIDEKLEPGSAVTLTLKEEKINIFSEDGTKNYLRG